LCKPSLALGVGALVELILYSVVVDKTPRIVVHNKKKNCTYILCSFVLFGDGLLMMYVADICLHTTGYKLTVISDE
jgi:hypothetical protein